MKVDNHSFESFPYYFLIHSSHFSDSSEFKLWRNWNQLISIAGDGCRSEKNIKKQKNCIKEKTCLNCALGHKLLV